MQKISSPQIPGLSADMVIDSFKRHGLPTLAMGSGLAGIVHLLALQKRQEEQSKKKQDAETIVINVPTKTANTQMGQYFWDAPLAVGSAIGGFGIGYSIIDSILKKNRKKQLESELDSLKKEYSDYMSQELTTDSKTAQYPILDGFILSIVDKVKDAATESYRKTACLNLLKKEAIAFLPPNFIPGSGAAAPQTQLQQAPQKGRETLGTLLTSLPGVFALLAGIATHNYYYNRSKDIDRGIEKQEAEEMQKAPKRVKIVSTPAQDTQKQETEELGGLLSKGAIDLLTAPIIEKIIEGTKDKVSPEQATTRDRDARREEPLVSDKDLQKVDDNTLMLLTDSGNVQVDALDPKALEALEKHKEKILKSFALGFNS
jgi:hypothetical protein